MEVRLQPSIVHQSAVPCDYVDFGVRTFGDGRNRSRKSGWDIVTDLKLTRSQSHGVGRSRWSGVSGGNCTGRSTLANGFCNFCLGRNANFDYPGRILHVTVQGSDPPSEQRGCSNLAAMAAYRFREVTQHVTLLPLAGLGDRE